MSSVLMQALIVAYVVIACVSAYEGNWARVVYWISASTLTVSVLWME
jgi:hypothetical protein